MEKTYKQYATLMADIAVLEEKKDMLKEVLLENLRKEPEGKKETGYGKFTLANRKNWIYTEKVKGMEEKVKIAKDKEQKKGLAKSTITEYVVFTIPKAYDAI